MEIKDSGNSGIKRRWLMTYKQAYLTLYDKMQQWLQDSRNPVSKNNSLKQDYSLSRCVNMARMLLGQIEEEINE